MLWVKDKRVTGIRVRVIFQTDVTLSAITHADNTL